MRWYWYYHWGLIRSLLARRTPCGKRLQFMPGVSLLCLSVSFFPPFFGCNEERHDVKHDKRKVGGREGGKI